MQTIILNSSPKDLKIAHLNICSIKNKIDELTVFQSASGFDVIAITETCPGQSFTNRRDEIFPPGKEKMHRTGMP